MVATVNDDDGDDDERINSHKKIKAKIKTKILSQDRQFEQVHGPFSSVSLSGEQKNS